MNRNKLELPKFLTEYHQVTEFKYQQEMSVSFMLIGLIIILKTLDKIL